MIRTICVHSFRAGTGKTHIIANIAVQMAQRGLRVGIIDADLYAPGMHRLFGLDPAAIMHCLNHYLRGESELARTVYRVDAGLDPFTREPIGLAGAVYLVPACSRLEAINRVWQEGYDLDLLHEAVSRLVIDLNLDYLLIDTHPGANEQYDILTAVFADLLLLTLCDDDQHFEGTAILLDGIRKLDDSNTYIIINRSPYYTDLEGVQRRVLERFGLELVARLPVSVELMLLGSSGIYTCYAPDDPWVGGIGQLLDFICRISV